MVKIFFIYCGILLGLTTFAQKQANTWYFGNREGLDFNQHPPVPLLTNAINSDEGGATISDNAGKLLFYTNGIVLVNRKNAIMKNGDGLLGDVSSTDNTIIVPAPSNDSIFYLFTIGAAYKLNKGLRYNVININGDAGYGEVTGKNILLEPTAFEKIAAVRHCNNKDVWIVIHKWDSDAYLAYLVTAVGVSDIPVVSHTGLTVTGNPSNSVGTLKFSNNGKKLAAAHGYENNVIELMNFDNATGKVSSPVVFHPDLASTTTTFTGVYGAEFSPNGNLLYVTDNITLDDPGFLYQFDISSNNAATIRASKYVITNTSSLFAGALQIGPDQKIYLAMVGDSALSVIDNPDVPGAGCNFNYGKVYLGGPNFVRSIQFGLPRFIQSSFNPLYNPYDFTRQGNCLAGSDITFKISKLLGIDSVKWDFGDGQKSQLLEPVIKYDKAGFYDVKLIVYKVDCSGLNDTIEKKIWIANTAIFLGSDTSSCDILSLQIGVDQIYGANYLWSTKELSNKINTSTTGLFWLEIEQKGCTVRDSVMVSAKPLPFVRIVAQDTLVCANKPLVLRAGNTTATEFLWNTGETTASITVDHKAMYYVRVTQNTCTASDTLNVVTGDCDIFIPSAFSPNNDGINDRFGILGNTTYQNFSMKIYNRYGQVVFSTNNISDKWDGKYKGKAVPVGAYPWSIVYINGQGYTKWMRGSVLVLH